MISSQKQPQEQLEALTPLTYWSTPNFGHISKQSFFFKELKLLYSTTYSKYKKINFILVAPPRNVQMTWNQNHCIPLSEAIVL